MCTHSQVIRPLHVAVHVQTMCVTADLMLIWPLQITWTFLHIAAADNDCHLRVIYCWLFYYTVTGGRGIIEVRRSYMNVIEGGAHHESQGLKNERGEMEIKADCTLDG